MDSSSREICASKVMTILDAETLVALSNLGAELVSGEGRVSVALRVSVENEKRVVRLLEREGFEVSESLSH